MGLFDRFISRKTSPAAGAAPAVEPTPSAAPTPSGGAVKPRLAAAHEKLAARDLPGAMAIYEEILAMAGDRADVLVAISGALGSHGHVAEIIELVAPRYDVDRHGPATGLNLLQAYLAVRNADAAQHVLDILFALNRPELEDRLHGFSNAIAEILATPDQVPTQTSTGGLAGDTPKIGLITISKPIWFYGLEPLAAQILPPKEARLRRIAFAQLALPGYQVEKQATALPDDELNRLSRALPLWFAETFYFSAVHTPIAAIGVKAPSGGGAGANHHMVFGGEWTTDNLRQLVETHGEGLDYIFTGALKENAGDYEVLMRVWEVETFREQKAFHARWTPSSADAALSQLHAQIRGHMNWSPTSAAFAYTIPPQARAWLETLGASLGLFLVDKAIISADQLAPVEADLQQVGRRAATSEAASLAYLTLRARAAKLVIALPAEFPLARSPLVQQAQKING